LRLGQPGRRGPRMAAGRAAGLPACHWHNGGRPWLPSCHTCGPSKGFIITHHHPPSPLPTPDPGGMTSPIASPQNIFAVERMSMDGHPPSWLSWFAVALPVAFAGNLVCWGLILAVYRPGSKIKEVGPAPARGRRRGRGALCECRCLRRLCAPALARAAFAGLPWPAPPLRACPG
jgi:hypothetical protein